MSTERVFELDEDTVGNNVIVDLFVTFVFVTLS